MYLQPWQIFAGGCVVGILITLIVLILIVVKFVRHSGVAVIREKEENKNE